MALSAEAVASLNEAKAAVEAWRADEEDRIQRQADFLATVNVEISSLSEESQEAATTSARALIDAILASS